MHQLILEQDSEEEVVVDGDTPRSLFSLLDVDFGVIATPHTLEDTDSSVCSGPHMDLSAPNDCQRTKDIFWRPPSMEMFLSPHGVLSSLSCRA